MKTLMIQMSEISCKSILKITFHFFITYSQKLHSTLHLYAIIQKQSYTLDEKEIEH